MAHPSEGGAVSRERFAGWCVASRVLVAFVFADRVLYVSGREIQRRHDGARQRLGPLAGMDGPCGESGLEIVVEDARHSLAQSGGEWGKIIRPSRRRTALSPMTRHTSGASSCG